MHQRRSGNSTTSSPSPAKSLIGGSRSDSNSTPSLVRSVTSRRRTLPIHLTPPPPPSSSASSLSGSSPFSPLGSSPYFLARLRRKRQRHYHSSDTSSVSFSSVYSALKETLCSTNISKSKDNSRNINNIRSRFNKIARGTHVRNNIRSMLRHHRFDGNIVNLWMVVKGILIFVATFVFVYAQWRQSSSSALTADELLAASNLLNEYSQVRNKADSRFKADTTSQMKKQEQQQYKSKPMTMVNNNQYDTDLQESDTYDIYNCPDEPPHGYPYHWALVDTIFKDWPIEDVTSLSSSLNEHPTREIYQGLCVFDFTEDYDKALRYRQAEVPFVVRNDKQVMQTVERWNDPRYVDWLLNLRTVTSKATDIDLDTNNNNGENSGKESSQKNLYHVDYSSTNHFLLVDHYQRHNNKVWAPLTSSSSPPPPKATLATTQQHIQDTTYDDWLNHANVANDADVDGNANDVSDQRHSFLRFNGCTTAGKVPQECDPMSTYFLHEELSFFAEESPEASDNITGGIDQTTQGKEPFYIIHDNSPNQQRYNKERPLLHHHRDQKNPQDDLQCLFGMRGNIIENHFDENRNTIVGLRGQARYILSHPDQCHHLGLLYPRHSGHHNSHHPYARYSALNWTKSHINHNEYGETDILATVLKEYPQLALAKGNEIVLQPGDVLYLPTFWFHWTVSLDMNIQCTRRSSPTQHYEPPVKACGY